MVIMQVSEVQDGTNKEGAAYIKESFSKIH